MHLHLYDISFYTTVNGTTFISLWQPDDRSNAPIRCCAFLIDGPRTREDADGSYDIASFAFDGNGESGRWTAQWNDHSLIPLWDGTIAVEMK